MGNHTPDSAASGEMEREIGSFRVDGGGAAPLADAAAPLVARTRGVHPVAAFGTVVCASAMTGAVATE